MNPIQSYRKTQNLTQRALAEKLGVSQGLISGIENGTKLITPQKARDWESILNVPREVLCPHIFDRRRST